MPRLPGEKRRVVCENLDGAGRCGRFLGELDGDVVRFYCPKCRAFHDVPATEVIEQLEGYLGELRARVKARQVKIGSL